MARFQVTFVFEVESVTSQEEALAYAKEVASEETMTTGEPVEVLDAEIV